MNASEIMQRQCNKFTLIKQQLRYRIFITVPSTQCRGTRLLMLSVVCRRL